jgi:polar amino acid transport system permease protein
MNNSRGDGSARVRRLLLADDNSGEGASLSARIFNAILVAAGLTALFYVAFRNVDYHWSWDSAWRYRQKFLTGWVSTILISAAALVCSTLIGTVAALARRSRILLCRYVGATYVEIIRCTPLLVQILIFWYVLANAANLQNRYVAGVLILSAFAGAYISEIIRSGIESVPESQLESARAIGLTPPQIYRYVIFPQATRQMLPPLTGQFVSLVKDSSLLSVIAINELTKSAQELNANAHTSFEGYLPLAVAYLTITFPLSMWTRSLEKKFLYES